MQELKFIKYISKKFKTKSPVIKGIGDDCAVLKYTRHKYLLLTCDMIIEGTHFTKRTAPYQIGWKAMAVNISDIASMGGIPKYALVSAGVSRSKGMKFLKEIVRGVDAISKKFGVNVIGGDTNGSGKTVVNVTLMGEVEKNCLVARSGAEDGDLIFVTGALGEGKTKHLNFEPRLKEARILVKNFKIDSMIDLSDGLAMDLNRLAKASGVGARVYKSLIPLPEQFQTRIGKLSNAGLESTLVEVISSGEDFELLFTASLKESKKMIKRMGKKGDLPITLIGEIVDKRFGVRLIGENGKTSLLGSEGFVHL